MTAIYNKISYFGVKFDWKSTFSWVVSSWIVWARSEDKVFAKETTIHTAYQASGPIHDRKIYTFKYARKGNMARIYMCLSSPTWQFYPYLFFYQKLASDTVYVGLKLKQWLTPLVFWPKGRILLVLWKSFC